MDSDYLCTIAFVPAVIYKCRPQNFHLLRTSTLLARWRGGLDAVDGEILVYGELQNELLSDGELQAELPDDLLVRGGGRSEGAGGGAARRETAPEGGHWAVAGGGETLGEGHGNEGK